MNDRETPGYIASDYINAILDSLRHYDKPKRTGNLVDRPMWASRALVTHVVCLDGGGVDVDDAVEVGLIEGGADDSRLGSESSVSLLVYMGFWKGKHRCLQLERWSGRWRGWRRIWSTKNVDNHTIICIGHESHYIGRRRKLGFKGQKAPELRCHFYTIAIRTDKLGFANLVMSIPLQSLKSTSSGSK